MLPQQPQRKPLTDRAIQALKPDDTGREFSVYDYHPDASGLHIAISKTGKKTFRLKARFQGKDVKLTIGTFPAISLKMAREKAIEAHFLIAQGVKPCRG